MPTGPRPGARQIYSARTSNKEQTFPKLLRSYRSTRRRIFQPIGRDGQAGTTIIHPSRKVIEFGSESVAKSILHRNPVDIEFCWPATRVYDPWKSSRHRTIIRVRVSGLVYHPSENSSHRIRVRVGGPVYPPGPGPFTVANIISSYRNSLSNSPCPLGGARGRGLI